MASAATGPAKQTTSSEIATPEIILSPDSPVFAKESTCGGKDDSSDDGLLVTSESDDSDSDQKGYDEKPVFTT